MLKWIPITGLVMLAGFASTASARAAIDCTAFAVPQLMDTTYTSSDEKAFNVAHSFFAGDQSGSWGDAVTKATGLGVDVTGYGGLTFSDGATTNTYSTWRNDFVNSNFSDVEKNESFQSDSQTFSNTLGNVITTCLNQNQSKLVLTATPDDEFGHVTFNMYSNPPLPTSIAVQNATFCTPYGNGDQVNVAQEPTQMTCTRKGHQSIIVSIKQPLRAQTVTSDPPARGTVFAASSVSVPAGNQVTLLWNTRDAKSQDLQGPDLPAGIGAVNRTGAISFKVTQDGTYILHVVRHDGSPENDVVQISVRRDLAVMDNGDFSTATLGFQVDQGGNLITPFPTNCQNGVGDLSHWVPFSKVLPRIPEFVRVWPYNLAPNPTQGLSDTVTWDVSNVTQAGFEFHLHTEHGHQSGPGGACFGSAGWHYAALEVQ